LCSSSNWQDNEVVLGCADHALYVVGFHKGLSLKRQLHSKDNGHQEFVTCVTYLPNGGILSGGMDGQLCLWAKGSTRSRSLSGVYLHEPSLHLCLAATAAERYFDLDLVLQVTQAQSLKFVWTSGIKRLRRLHTTRLSDCGAWTAAAEGAYKATLRLSWS
jgi:WD40 repeat protein